MPKTLYLKTLTLICIVAFICSSIATFSQSCDVNGRKHYTFNEIKTVLDKNKCNNCHYKSNLPNAWSYENYNDLFVKNACGVQVIFRGKPNESLLIDKLNGGPTSCGNAMPIGGQRISNADLLAIESWIEFGAPEFCVEVYDKVRDILADNKCYSCHNAQNSWSFSSYSSIFMKPANSTCSNPEIEKYNADASLLYKKILGSQAPECGATMLVEGQKMKDTDVSKIRDWINAGAPESALALPVSLSEFRTELINGNDIFLFWKTSAENNTSHFDIETSTNGINFSKVGDVNSLGSPSNYSFKYINAVTGFNYFRLKIVDHDRLFSYAPIRVERVANEDEILKVYPMPAQKNASFTVEWYPTDGREKVRTYIMDIHGNLTQEFVLNNGVNNIDLQAFKTGVYYISIEDYNAVRKLKKIIILDN